MFTRLSKKMRVHVIRCANIYGYSPAIRFDAVINRFAWKAHFEGRISIEGDGSQYRSFVHVDAAAKATAGLIGTEVDNGIFNLIGFNMPVIGIADALQQLYPDLERIFIELDMPRAGIQVLPSPEFKLRTPDLVAELKEFTKRFSYSR